MPKKRLLFLSWRDIKHPSAGGAEIFTHEMLKRLASEGGYEIHHFSPSFQDGLEVEVIDGVHYFRKGNTLSVILKARRFYHQSKRGYDLVVDQCNTHQFFTPLWLPRSQEKILFIHQLTREIWFSNMNLIMASIGYMLEPIMLKLHKKSLVWTVSNSTRMDLVSLGFKDERIKVLPEGLDFLPWKESQIYTKEKDFTVIYLGRFAKYKGIEKAIESFALLHKNHPESKMWLVGKAPLKVSKAFRDFNC